MHRQRKPAAPDGSFAHKAAENLPYYHSSEHRGGFIFMKEKDLLLVVDMQNVYFPGQPWECPSMPQALDRIQMLLQSPACGNSYDVAFTRHVPFRHPKGQWKLYNEKTSSISSRREFGQILSSLQPFLDRWPCYEKSTYSACSVPALMEKLKEYRRVLLSGVVAECCVLFTAAGLVDAGIQVVYLYDAAAGQEPEYEALLCRLMRRYAPVHTLVMTAGDYLACLKIQSTQSE